MTSSVELQMREEDASALPSELRDIEVAIHESRTVAELEDDWDGEGSPGYAVSTLDRATEFLLGNALSLWKSLEVPVPAPVIGPGPDGSIDINWQLAARKLLVNVPVDANKPATFYGRDRTGHDTSARNVIEGCLDMFSDNQWLLMWIAM